MKVFSFYSKSLILEMNDYSSCEEKDKMSTVQLESKNGVSTITFNRPEQYNALDLETLQAFLSVLKEMENNTDQAVILTGAGKAFSAGGDIRMMTSIDETQYEELMETLKDIALRLYMLPKIIISAIYGSAAGLGLSLALSADYMIAHEEAKLGMLFAGIGLVPDGGGHFHLKERLGVAQAKHFIWELEQVDGKAAKDLGLVDIVTDEEVTTAAQTLAQKSLHSPIQALIESKLILHETKKTELTRMLDREKQGQLKMSQTKDHQEGVQAFLEKRQPSFKGK